MAVRKFNESQLFWVVTMHTGETTEKPAKSVSLKQAAIATLVK